MVKKREIPYITILVFSYLTVYTLIKHKELRFILPIIPFCYLMLGYTLHKAVKSQYNSLRLGTSLMIMAFLVVELAMGAFYLTNRLTLWKAIKHIQDQPSAAHSIYTLRLDMPYYSWTHRREYIGFDGKPTNRTFFPMLQMDPTFVRLSNGHPIAILENTMTNRCFQLIDAI